MKMWKDMTPEEKGALLLAEHEGKEIQFWYNDCVDWQTCFGSQGPGRTPQFSYRIKPEPKVEVVSIRGYQGLYMARPTLWFGPSSTTEDTHRITFNLVDGVPDCSSIKMEKL